MNEAAAQLSNPETGFTIDWKIQSLKFLPAEWVFPGLRFSRRPKTRPSFVETVSAVCGAVFFLGPDLSTHKRIDLLSNIRNSTKKY
jgi:hypothetical protein